MCLLMARVCSYNLLMIHSRLDRRAKGEFSIEICGDRAQWFGIGKKRSAKRSGALVRLNSRSAVSLRSSD